MLDTIPYSFAITDELTFADTIYGFRRSVALDFDFAFLVPDTTSHGGTPGGHGDDTTHHDTIVEPVFYSLTFLLTDGSTPLFEGYVTMNGIEKMTDSLGIVRFDSIAAETPISYVAKVCGYDTFDGQAEQSDTITLTANTSITIVFKAIPLPPSPPPVSVIENAASEIIVYPNPSDGLLYIQNADGQEFVLVDKNGRMLQTGTIESGQIDLRPIATGIYTLIIKYEDGISSTQVVIY